MLSKINKESLKALLTKCFSAVANIATSLLSSLIMVSIIMFLGAKAPEIHGLLIRKSVGSKVYAIRVSLTGGGGTGFAMRAASGLSYIVTNDHVCQASLDKRTMLVVNDEGKYIRRSIIMQSDKTDLCLLEGVPGVSGLELGSAPSLGQIVAAVGHPSLRPITLSRGEIIGAENVEIPVGLIVDEPTEPIFGIEFFTPKECSKPKNRIRNASDFFGNRIQVCTTVTTGAYMSNALIQPGSSGSPVVNFWGNVIGVVFAGDKYGWGSFVSFEDLEELLSMY